MKNHPSQEKPMNNSLEDYLNQFDKLNEELSSSETPLSKQVEIFKEMLSLYKQCSTLLNQTRQEIETIEQSLKM